MESTLLDLLKSRFGHDSFRYPQREVVETLLRGRHALVVLPTGGGKSLAYQLPAILPDACWTERDEAKSQRQPLTVVLSPLIALMKDQVDTLVKKGIDATFINSSLGKSEREQRYAAVANGNFDLLYVTPERFRKDAFREVIARRFVRLLAVDEAHCISEWGHDFRPDYTRLAEIRELLGSPVTVALTATATPDVQADIIRQLGLSESEIDRFCLGIDRPNLSLQVQEVWGETEKRDILEEFLRGPRQTGIVYFTLIKTLLQFSDYLRESRIEHLVYHGELPRGERRHVQECFMTGADELVLATNAFGLGVDKENVRFVIHADVPGALESYYQEVGRAGRDGLPARCNLLYDQSDLATQMEFIRWSNPDADYYQRLYDYLAHDAERIACHGLEWLRKELHHKDKGDRRLESALAMLDRYGAITIAHHPWEVRVIAPLPDKLLDTERSQQKLQRDLEKLQALVSYIRTPETERQAFLANYFGA